MTNTNSNTVPELPARFARLYRAFVNPSDYRGTEHAVFVEACCHSCAIQKIAVAVAALEQWTPADVADRIYNCDSARELVDKGDSDDLGLRLLESGWSNNRPTFVSEPLFLLDAPAALIRKWAAIPAAEQPAQAG